MMTMKIIMQTNIMYLKDNYSGLMISSMFLRYFSLL